MLDGGDLTNCFTSSLDSNGGSSFHLEGSVKLQCPTRRRRLLFEDTKNPVHWDKCIQDDLTTALLRTSLTAEGQEIGLATWIAMGKSSTRSREVHAEVLPCA